MNIMTTKTTTMARIAIQAPWTNFVTSTTTRTVPVTLSPKALIARLVCILRLAAALSFDTQAPGPVDDHAGLAGGERDEDSHDVELDQPGDLGLEGDDE